MNGACGLCQFCEYHGPRLVYYTHPISIDNNNCNYNCSESFTEEQSTSIKGCGCGCGPGESPPIINSIIKDDSELYRTSSTLYHSHKPGITDTVTADLLKLAAVRSLSCEVSSNTDDALVFFGDETRGYVLSYAFQIQDTRARGLKRWFSLVVLMLDKMYLLNLTPFFSKQFKIVAEKLINLAEKVYTEEQSQCSQRSLRLRNGMNTCTPRSLVDLTKKENVFAYLHTEFCWTLSSASKMYSESYNNPLMNSNTIHVERDKFSITNIKKYLGHEVFCKIVYCALIGIQVIIRGDSQTCLEVLYMLYHLLPGENTIQELDDYVPSCKILYCKTAVAVPQPCEGICRLDIVNESPVLHWTGQESLKFPTYMLKIVKSIDSDNLKENLVQLHLIALKEEWINNCTALKNTLQSTSSKEDTVCLKKVLGITVHDEPMMEYWSTLIQ